jgi:hypothetical protein
MSWSYDYWADRAEAEMLGDDVAAIGTLVRGSQRARAKYCRERIARGVCPRHAAPIVPGRRCCARCLAIGRAKRGALHLGTVSR